MIEFSNVYKKYLNGHEALVRANFSLPDGEMIFLTGPSGAGKSTFLKVAGSLERATRGQVIVNGVDLMTLPKRKIAAFRRRLGIVLQDPNLLLDKSAYDNVALPLIIAGVGRTEVGKRVRAALDKVGLLSKEKFLAEELSTGEQQRVGLARAIVNKPDLILADEPTGNLDPELSEEILNLFVEFNRVGTTVVIASHDIDLIKSVDKRIIYIEDGRLINAE
jgi:cell division transport system ATP-binding protein